MQEGVGFGRGQSGRMLGGGREGLGVGYYLSQLQGVELYVNCVPLFTKLCKSDLCFLDI